MLHLYGFLLVADDPPPSPPLGPLLVPLLLGPAFAAEEAVVVVVVAVVVRGQEGDGTSSTSAAGHGRGQSPLAGGLVDRVQVGHGVVVHQQDVLLREGLLADVALVGAAGVVVALQGVAGGPPALPVQLGLVVGRQVALPGEAHLAAVALELAGRVLVVAHGHGLAVDEVLQGLLVRELALQLLVLVVLVHVVYVLVVVVVVVVHQLPSSCPCRSRLQPSPPLLSFPGHVGRQGVNALLPGGRSSVRRRLLHHVDRTSLALETGRRATLGLGGLGQRQRQLAAEKVGQEALEARAAGQGGDTGVDVSAEGFQLPRARQARVLLLQMGPVGPHGGEALAALAALGDGLGQVVQAVRLQGPFVPEGLQALPAAEGVLGGGPPAVPAVGDVAAPGVDLPEVDLQGLRRLEVLVAAFLPAQVARAARGLLELQVAQLRLVGVQVLDVGEGARARLAAELAVRLVAARGAAAAAAGGVVLSHTWKTHQEGNTGQARMDHDGKRGG